MSPVHLSFRLALNCLVHLHILHILESSPVLKFLPEHITRFVMTSNVNTISPLKILILNLRLVHSDLLPSAAVLPLHICHILIETRVTITDSELFELHWIACGCISLSS